jgi:hypothetical protein
LTSVYVEGCTKFSDDIIHCLQDFIARMKYVAPTVRFETGYSFREC